MDKNLYRRFRKQKLLQNVTFGLWSLESLFITPEVTTCPFLVAHVTRWPHVLFMIVLVAAAGSRPRDCCPQSGLPLLRLPLLLYLRQACTYSWPGTGWPSPGDSVLLSLVTWMRNRDWEMGSHPPWSASLQTDMSFPHQWWGFLFPFQW